MATAASGTVYRLRQGIFTLTGESTGHQAQVSTETDPSRTSLLVALPPDTFAVFLEPGFYLERLSSTGMGEPVESSLASPNPTYIEISPDAVTSVDFAFSTPLELAQTGRGVLDLGIEVSERAPCNDDAFEPNDDESQATVITSGTGIDARLCGAFGVDHYRFESPVPAGLPFRVTASFVGEVIQFSATLRSATSGATAIATPNETGAGVSVVSDGGAYQLEIFAFGYEDAGLDYHLDVGPIESAGNTCCEASSAPGCSNSEVFACMCAEDEACCLDAWDEACVIGAITSCGLECSPGPTSDCCSAGEEPGCLVAEVEQCVCAIDPFCCVNGFDDNCATLARTQCGATCE